MSNFFEIQKLVELFDSKRDEHSDSEGDGEAASIQHDAEGEKPKTSKGQCNFF